MDSMGNGLKKKRLIPVGQAGDFVDTDTVLQRNRILESAGLDNFLIRLPRLKLHVHFYYKFVEGGMCAIGDHSHHQHWEITRICAGNAEYSVHEDRLEIHPDAAHYLIVPPRVTHGWSMSKVPLLMNSWQVCIEAEDEAGEQTIRNLKKTVLNSGFTAPVTRNQIQAEALLWQITGEERSPQLFGSILSGFARIVLGELFAQLNPWPDGLLVNDHDPELAADALAQRLRIFLDENIENPITLSDLEGHFHYSERHLNRIFQKVHHVSIGQYLRRQRIDLAKRWLETTDRSIKDIAFSLGYSMPSQFCRYFNVQCGMTPSQYRDSQKEIQRHQLNLSVVRCRDEVVGKK